MDHHSNWLEVCKIEIKLQLIAVGHLPLIETAASRFEEISLMQQCDGRGATAQERHTPVLYN